MCVELDLLTSLWTQAAKKKLHATSFLSSVLFPVYQVSVFAADDDVCQIYGRIIKHVVETAFTGK